MLNRFREFFARQKQRQVMVNLVDMWAARKPLTDLWDVKKFADEGYRRNSLIFACIALKSTSFMEPELLAYTENQENEETELPPEHMLSVLLSHPNTRDSQSTFFRRWMTHLDVAGNVYTLKLRNNTGMPISWRFLRPDCTRPIPNSEGEIVAYEYGEQSQAGGYTQIELETGVESSGSRPQVIPASEIIHEMGAPDPIDPYRGISPIAVLARMGDLDNYAADYLRSFFLNAGIPSGLLKFKTQVTKPIRDKVREDWKERYSLRSFDKTSIGGAFDLFVTDADVEYQEIGSKLKMMDLEQVFGETESRICSTFGVPPILIAAYIGLMRSTMANYEQAIKHFYRATMKPLWVSAADRITIDLAASEFGANIVCKFDLDDIAELQEDRTKQRQLALEAWNSSLITRNEGRKEFGVDPDPVNGDVYKVSAQDTFEAAATTESAPQRTGRGTLTEAQRLWIAERHARGDYRQLHQVADNVEPLVKKKSPLRLTSSVRR